MAQPVGAEVAYYCFTTDRTEGDMVNALQVAKDLFIGITGLDHDASQFTWIKAPFLERWITMSLCLQHLRIKDGGPFTDGDVEESIIIYGAIHDAEGWTADLNARTVAHLQLVINGLGRVVRSSVR